VRIPPAAQGLELSRGERRTGGRQHGRGLVSPRPRDDLGSAVRPFDQEIDFSPSFENLSDGNTLPTQRMSSVNDTSSTRICVIWCIAWVWFTNRTN